MHLVGVPRCEQTGWGTLLRMTDGDDKRPTCFIAMPIRTREAEVSTYAGDTKHWEHVRESLFVPAVTAAGFEPIIPVAKGAWLIHEMIVKNLETADLVLVDLSANNPNVFFEMGVRTSLDLPVALVWDNLTTLPFDTSGINTHEYDPTLSGWKLDDERRKLTEHLGECVTSCAGKNPLWRRFGLESKAREATIESSPDEARFELLTERVELLTAMIEETRLAYPPYPSPATRTGDRHHRTDMRPLFVEEAMMIADVNNVPITVAQSARAENEFVIQLERDKANVDLLDQLAELAAVTDQRLRFRFTVNGKFAYETDGKRKGSD